MSDVINYLTNNGKIGTIETYLKEKLNKSKPEEIKETIKKIYIYFKEYSGKENKDSDITRIIKQQVKEGQIYINEDGNVYFKGIKLNNSNYEEIISNIKSEQDSKQTKKEKGMENK
jgi:uncharacterized membrane protein